MTMKDYLKKVIKKDLGKFFKFAKPIKFVQYLSKNIDIFIWPHLVMDHVL